MSSAPVLLSPLPSDTSSATKAVFNLTNAYLVIGDQANGWLRDTDFAEGSPTPDQSVVPTPRLAFITIFQFAEDISDQRASVAVRTRMDWKYALHLPLKQAGFDHTLLSDYRQRLLCSPLDHRLLQHLIGKVAAIGLLPLTERQGIDVADILSSIDHLNRIEELFDAQSAALSVMETCWPVWLRTVALPQWSERYCHSASNLRLPHGRSEQENLTKIIGEDAHYLLEAIDRAGPVGASDLVEIRLLRTIEQQ
jgi:transposase